MTEATVVNLFFTFRVFLVGGILLAFPRITRKGLVFGTYLGEELAAGGAVAELRRSWDRWTAVVMAVSLAIGWAISLGGRPVPGNLTGTAVLLTLSLVLFFWMYGKARKLAPPAAARQAMMSSASLEVDEARGEGLAKVALALCVFTALASAMHATYSYEALPDRIPTLADLLGLGDEMAEKSLVLVLLFPSYNIVLTPFFALTGLLIAGAKRSVRGGSGGRSAEAQNTFRAAMAHIFSGIALFLCLILAVFSLDIIEVAGGGAESPGVGVVLLMVAMILYIFWSLIRIYRGIGQGGALLEDGSVDAPLAGELTDNAHWFLGVTYINRDDPSTLVESRFFGYTYNLGNRLSLLIIGTFLTACLGLTVLTLMAMGVFR